VKLNIKGGENHVTLTKKEDKAEHKEHCKGRILREVKKKSAHHREMGGNQDAGVGKGGYRSHL